MELISENRRGKGKKNASTQARRSSRRAGRNDALLTTVVSNSCFHRSSDIDSTERPLSDYTALLCYGLCLWRFSTTGSNVQLPADIARLYVGTKDQLPARSPIRGVKRQNLPRNRQLSEVEAARRFCMDLPNNVDLDNGLGEK
jgi:hypothetical protein